MELAELTEAVQAELDLVDRDAFVDTADLRAVRVLRERAEALELAATAAWDRAERWRADGHLTAAAALRAEGVPSLDAGRIVRAGRLVARNERLAKLLAVGDVTAEHIHALARHASVNGSSCSTTTPMS